MALGGGAGAGGIVVAATNAGGKIDVYLPTGHQFLQVGRGVVAQFVGNARINGSGMTEGATGTVGHTGITDMFLVAIVGGIVGLAGNGDEGAGPGTMAPVAAEGGAAGPEFTAGHTPENGYLLTGAVAIRILTLGCCNEPARAGTGVIFEAVDMV